MESKWQRPRHQLAPLPSDLYLLPPPLPPEGRALCAASLEPRALVPVLWASIWTPIATHTRSHSLQSNLPPCPRPPPPHPCTQLPHSPFSSCHVSDPGLLVATGPSLPTETLAHTLQKHPCQTAPRGRDSLCAAASAPPGRAPSATPPPARGDPPSAPDLDSLSPRRYSAYPRPPELVAEAEQSSAH